MVRSSIYPIVSVVRTIYSSPTNSGLTPLTWRLTKRNGHNISRPSHSLRRCLDRSIYNLTQALQLFAYSLTVRGLSMDDERSLGLRHNVLGASSARIGLRVRRNGHRLTHKRVINPLKPVAYDEVQITLFSRANCPLLSSCVQTAVKA